jgi:hypothetical protein
MRRFKLKLLYISFLLVCTINSYAQLSKHIDTVGYTIDTNEIIKLDNEYYSFSLIKSKDSIILINIYNEKKELLKIDEYLFLDNSFKPLYTFDIASRNVVVSEIGQSRFLGVINSEYVFEVFRFHREGITNHLLYYTLEFLPIKKQTIYLSRQGEVLKSSEEVYTHY